MLLLCIIVVSSSYIILVAICIIVVICLKFDERSKKGKARLEAWGCFRDCVDLKPVKTPFFEIVTSDNLLPEDKLQTSKRPLKQHNPLGYNKLAK